MTNPNCIYVQDSRRDLHKYHAELLLALDRSKRQLTVTNVNSHDLGETVATLSPASSRMGSSSPSVFSDPGVSDSSASSVGTHDQSRRSYEVSVNHSLRNPQQRNQFLRTCGETLHEESIVCKDTRDILITKSNPRRAFLDRKHSELEKNLLVRDNLDWERRQIRREKVRKERLRAPEPAITPEKKPHSLTASDGLLLDPSLESGEILRTEIVYDIREPDGVSLECKIPPVSALTEATILKQMADGVSSTLTRQEFKRNCDVPFSMNSQTDVASIEDATDWGEDFDTACFPDITQLTLTSEDRRTVESKPLLARSNPKFRRSEAVDRVMVKFRAIFDNRWSTDIRKCSPVSGDGNSPAKPSSSTSDGASRSTLGVRLGKHYRPEDKEDEEADDYRSRRPKQPDKLPVVEEEDTNLNQFACPYRKHSPWKYCVQEWPRCALTPFQTIARLKAHLYKYHLIQQCQRCKVVFEKEEYLDAHIVADERCDVKIGDPVDGITRKMKDQIQCRRKTHRGQTNAEKWEQIYKILFPNEAVPDPYFEPVPDHDRQSPQSPESIILADYEAYLRRFLPVFVRNALEDTVCSELQGIEAQLQARMIEIIQEAQDRAFLYFRNMHQSASEARLAAGLDTDVAAAVESNHQTAIETFSQAPQPAIYSMPISNLSEVSVVQPSLRSNASNDSGYASRPSLSSSLQCDAPLDTIESDSASLSSDPNSMQKDLACFEPFDFDIMHFLDFDGTNDPAASDGLDPLQSLTVPPLAVPTAALSPKEAPVLDCLPAQLRLTSEDVFLE